MKPLKKVPGCDGTSFFSLLIRVLVSLQIFYDFENWIWASFVFDIQKSNVAPPPKKKTTDSTCMVSMENHHRLGYHPPVYLHFLAENCWNCCISWWNPQVFIRGAHLHCWEPPSGNVLSLTLQKWKDAPILSSRNHRTKWAISHGYLLLPATIIYKLEDKSW